MKEPILIAQRPDPPGQDRGRGRGRPQPPEPPNDLQVIERDPIMDMADFESFSCKVPKDSPDTPDWTSPDVFFDTEMDTMKLRMPDGQRIDMFIFRDADGDEVFPSRLVRVHEGQVVHHQVKSRKNTHTIHHHGIEPTTMNDGVGHTSFDISSRYTYQFRVSAAGTYFYHCHKNTVLHFELGMYGFLIVDPMPDPNDPPGTRRAFTGGPIYHAEALWAFDEIDPRWHKMHHDAGLKCPYGEDVGLNIFEPEYFLISGVAAPLTETDNSVVLNARQGENILLRILNAGYTVHQYRIQGLNGQVIAMDGRALGAPSNPYSYPIAINSGDPFELTTARRWDVLIQNAPVGNYPVDVQFKHWITGQVLGTARTWIRVSA